MDLNQICEALIEEVKRVPEDRWRGRRELMTDTIKSCVSAMGSRFGLHAVRGGLERGYLTDANLFSTVRQPGYDDIRDENHWIYLADQWVLALESELKRHPWNILYDFRKLTLTQSLLKVMVIDGRSFRKSLDMLRHYAQPWKGTYLVIGLPTRNDLALQTEIWET